MIINEMQRHEIEYAVMVGMLRGLCDSNCISEQQYSAAIEALRSRQAVAA